MPSTQISLFATCFNDTFFPNALKATVKVLEDLNCKIDFRLDQTCCGQMHLNTGYQKEAIQLMKRTLDIFQDANLIVAPSASCIGMMREGYLYLAKETNDSSLIEKVQAFIPKAYEFTEFIVKVLGVEDLGAYYPHSVTYHPTCHSLRVLELGDIPLRLLKKVRGINLIELEESDECCGFGGTFSVKNPQTSTAMLSDKMRHVLNTGAEICTACDTSCLMHIGGGLDKMSTGVGTLHIAEILASRQQDYDD